MKLDIPSPSSNKKYKYYALGKKIQIQVVSMKDLIK